MLTITTFVVIRLISEFLNSGHIIDNLSYSHSHIDNVLLDHVDIPYVLDLTLILSLVIGIILKYKVIADESKQNCFYLCKAIQMSC